MKNTSLKLLFFTVALCVLAFGFSPGAMAQTTWTGGATGDWNTAGNWSAGVPDGTDVVTFNGTDGAGTAGSVTITLSGAGAAAGFTFTGTETVTLNLDGNNFLLDDTGGTAAITVNGNSTLTVTSGSAATFTMEDGTTHALAANFTFNETDSDVTFTIPTAIGAITATADATISYTDTITIPSITFTNFDLTFSNTPVITTGDFTVDGTGGEVTFSGTSTLQVGPAGANAVTIGNAGGGGDDALTFTSTATGAFKAGAISVGVGAALGGGDDATLTISGSSNVVGAISLLGNDDASALIVSSGSTTAASFAPGTTGTTTASLTVSGQLTITAATAIPDGYMFAGNSGVIAGGNLTVANNFTLDFDGNNMQITANIVPAGIVTIEVAANTFYSGAAITAAGQINIAESGTFGNSNEIILGGNNLVFADGSSATVSNVQINGAGIIQVGQTDGDAPTITSLEIVAPATSGTIDFQDANGNSTSLTLTNGIDFTELTATKTLTLTSTVANAGTHTLKGGPLTLGTYGVLDVDLHTSETFTLENNIVPRGKATVNLEVNTTYEGAAITLDNTTSLDTLIFTGGFAFANDSGNSISVGDENVLMFDTNDGASFGHVTIAHADAKIDVDATATIDTFQASAGFEIDFISQKTLTLTEAFTLPASETITMTGSTGGVLNGTGGIDASASGAVISTEVSGVMSLGIPITTGGGSGSMLQFIDIVNVSKPISFAGDATIQLGEVGDAGGVLDSVNYFGGNMSVGANTITFPGTGAFNNSTGAFMLDNAASIIEFTGDSRLNRVTIDADDPTIKLNGGDGEIALFANTSSYDFFIEYADANTFTLNANLDLGTDQVVTVKGTGAGTLDAASAGNGDILIDSDGAQFVVNNSSSAGITIGNDIDLGLAGFAAATQTVPKLDILTRAKITGDITTSGGTGQVTIDDDVTLTYEGAAYTVDDTLILADNGTLTNTNAITVGTTGDAIKFTGNMTVKEVAVATTVTGDIVLVDAAPTITTLDLSANNADLDVNFINSDDDESSTLTVTNTIDVGAGSDIEFATGMTGIGTFAGGEIDLSTSTAGLNFNNDSLVTVSNNIRLGASTITYGATAGTYKAKMTGDITITGNANFIVNDEDTLYYEGDEMNVGSNTVTFTQDGVFNNAGSPFDLNSDASVLVLNNTGNVYEVKSTDDEGLIQAGANATIKKLDLSVEGVRVEYTANSVTLKLDDAVTLAAGKKIWFIDSGASSVALDQVDTSSKLDISTGASILEDDEGVDFKINVQAGSATADTVNIDATAGTNFENPTFTGAVVVDLDNDVTFDKLEVTGASVVTLIGDSELDFAGVWTLEENIQVTTDSAWSDAFDFTNLTTFTVDNSDGVTATFDSAVSFDGLITAGTIDEIVTLASTAATQVFELPNTVTINGIAIGDDDTLKFDAPDAHVFGTGGILEAAGGVVLLEVDTDQTYEGFFKTSAGTFIVQDTSTTARHVISFNGGASNLAGVWTTGGEIIFPGDDTLRADTNDYTLRTTGGLTRGASNDAKLYIDVGTNGDDIVNELTGGTIKWLHFSSAISNTATDIECINFVIKVYVSKWYEGTDGIGSIAKPFTTIAEAIAESDSTSTILVEAGIYDIDTTLVINKDLTIQGYQSNDLTWTTSSDGGTGADDQAPVFRYSGMEAIANMVTIESDTSDTVGIDVELSGLRFEFGAMTPVGIDLENTLNDITIDQSTFELTGGAMAVAIGEGDSLVNLAITNNDIMSDATTSWFHVGGMNGGFQLVTISGNKMTNVQTEVWLGDGLIRQFVFQTNDIYGGNGVMVGKAADATGAFEYKSGNTPTIFVDDNDFMNDVGYAFYADASLAVTDFNRTGGSADIVDDYIKVNDNNFFFVSGTMNAVENMMTGVDTLTEYVNAEDNWWGHYEGPMSGKALTATASSNVEYSPFKLEPSTVPGGLVITGVDANQTAYTGIQIAVYVASTENVFFTTNFDADVPEGPIEVKSGAFTVDNNVFTIVPTNTMDVTEAKITVYAGSGTGSFATTNMFNIAKVTVGAPSNFDATDAPGDMGGKVQFTFTPSANHAGYTAVDGYAGDVFPIDYYNVYASTTNDFATAADIGYFLASPKVDGSGDNIMKIFETGMMSGYYWIAAVKGYVPSPPTGETVAFKLYAEMEEDVVAAMSADRVASEAIGPNFAVSVNDDGSGDYTGDGVVGLDDLALFATGYGSDEYEAAFDFDGDGDVNLSDLALFAQKYGDSEGMAKGSALYTDGVNGAAKMEIKSTMDNSNEFLTVDVLARDAESLAGYSFDFVYDSQVYEFIDAGDGGFLEENDGAAPLFITRARDGRVSVANVLAGLNKPVAGEGVIARLTFRWIGDDSDEISVDNIAVLDGAGKLNSLEKFGADPVPVPEKFELKSNFPNPFNPETTISFALPKADHVKIVIYNVLGQKVRTLVDQDFKASFHTVKWNATNDMGQRVASGMYIYRIISGKNVASKKMMLLK